MGRAMSEAILALDPAIPIDAVETMDSRLAACVRTRVFERSW